MTDESYMRGVDIIELVLNVKEVKIDERKLAPSEKERELALKTSIECLDGKSEVGSMKTVEIGSNDSEMDECSSESKYGNASIERQSSLVDSDLEPESQSSGNRHEFYDSENVAKNNELSKVQNRRGLRFIHFVKSVINQTHLIPLSRLLLLFTPVWLFISLFIIYIQFASEFDCSGNERIFLERNIKEVFLFW